MGAKASSTGVTRRRPVSVTEALVAYIEAWMESKELVGVSWLLREERRGPLKRWTLTEEPRASVSSFLWDLRGE